MINPMEHLPMVTKIAEQFYKKLSYRYEYDDLFQAGCVGLMKAIKKFDGSKNFKFSTFAYTTIWGTIHNLARDDNWYIAKRNRDRLKESYAPTSLDMLVGKQKNTPLVEIMSGACNWENAVEVRIAINKLPIDLKEIIVKKYFQEYKFKELSAELGISKTMVNRRIRKALNMLREELTVC